MTKLIKISVFAFLAISLSECCPNNCDKNINTNEISSKGTTMNTVKIYPDSLTPIQKSSVEKAFFFATDSKYESWEVGPWEVDNLMTENEKDALVELAIWNYRKKYKPIENKVIIKRFIDVFGYDFESFANMTKNKQTDNLLSLRTTNPEIEFLISKKENIIIHWQGLYPNFNNYDDVSSFYPMSKTDSISLGNLNVSSLEYTFHLNNYLFNEANVSRTWLLNKDKYFMAHLLIQYGYDGDNEINKMVLKTNRNNDNDIIDMPVSVFHVYPDNKVKILDGLLKSAADLSTADCADYFEWATSIVDRFNASAFYKEEPSDDYDRSNPLEVEDYKYRQKIYNLTSSQKREIIAHVVNYMLPVYQKYIDGNMNYGSQSLDSGDLRIIDCFWNAMMMDHDLISEIEKNNYYGLTNLESLVLAMKDFEPFYNEETGVFEPWNYVPMRYRNAGE